MMHTTYAEAILFFVVQSSNKKKSINAIYINIMGIRKHEQNLKTKYIGPERLKSVI